MAQMARFVANPRHPPKLGFRRKEERAGGPGLVGFNIAAGPTSASG
jgi:hypothetical protein